MTKPNTTLADAKALELALTTLEAAQAAAEDRGDWAAAEALEPLLDDLGHHHLWALITSTGGTVHEMPAEFLAINAGGGEA